MPTEWVKMFGPREIRGGGWAGWRGWESEVNSDRVLLFFFFTN